MLRIQLPGDASYESDVDERGDDDPSYHPSYNDRSVAASDSDQDSEDEEDIQLFVM